MDVGGVRQAGCRQAMVIAACMLGLSPRLVVAIFC